MKTEIGELARLLETDGYVILPNRINLATCQSLKRKLSDLYLEHCPKYAETNAASSELASKSAEEVVFNLHNKGRDFWPLFEDPVALQLIGERLKQGSWEDSEPWYLNNISARNPLPGSQGQTLHVDSNVPGLNRTLFMNALWCLDDFNPSNGTTRVIPGSHKRPSFPETGASYPDEIAIVANAGSVILFDGALWHAGSPRPKDAKGSRWALVLGYARWWIKPSFDTARNTPLQLWDEMSEAMQRLLGFDSIPPLDEFTRMRRRSSSPERPRK